MRKTVTIIVLFLAACVDRAPTPAPDAGSPPCLAHSTHDVCPDAAVTDGAP